MSGFQFVHCQQYSRKSISSKEGKGGRSSVADVLAEAGRELGASLHVDHPAPPLVVLGLDPAGVGRLHDARVEVARCEVSGGKARKVRVDQATLLTVVASYLWHGRTVRSSISGTVEVKLDSSRIRRRLDSRLDSIMGLVPKGLR